MKKTKIFVLGLMTLISTSAFALFGGGGGASTGVLLKILAVETASKSEHIKNTIEAIEQTKKLATQVEYDIRNAMQLGKDVLLKILAVETASKSEHIKNTIEAIEQTKKLATQVEYDIRNAMQLGKDIASGNEYAIQDLIHKTLNYQETAQSIMYEQDKMLAQMESIFKTADSLKGMDITQLNSQLKKVKDQSQYAVYDAMTNAGFSATLNQDKQNITRLVNSANSAQGQLQVLQAISNLLGEQNAILLKMGTLMETNQDKQNITRLVNSANSAQGQLQVLQAISNLLGEQNAILLKMGTLMETQTKSVAIAQGATNTEEAIDKKSQEEYQDKEDKAIEKDLKEFKKAGSKKFKIGG